jgi:hypothetical protein
LHDDTIILAAARQQSPYLAIANQKKKKTPKPQENAHKILI